MGMDKQDRGGEADARRIRDQQHTGNHERAPGEDPDRFAGTRAGAENIEPSRGAGKKR